ncbi:MAG: hypothetical protein AB7S75_04230 [Desulfococcaceae bacterium]
METFPASPASASGFAALAKTRAPSEMLTDPAAFPPIPEMEISPPRPVDAASLKISPALMDTVSA